MRGRKPKPVALQISEGDPRKIGKRKLMERLANEPKASAGLPLCPRHLQGRARAAWNFWCSELKGMKQDFRCDAMMLEGACVNYARAVLADIAIAKAGITVEEPIVSRETGDILGYKIKNHPAVTVSNVAWRQVRAFCSEFGLSPVSRTRLTIEKDDAPGDDLATLLSKPRERKTEAAVQ